MKNFFKNFKSYNFWVSFSGALIILLNAFGRAFGFSIQNQIVEDCVMSIAGILVVLGIVVRKKDKSENNEETKADLPETDLTEKDENEKVDEK